MKFYQLVQIKVQIATLGVALLLTSCSGIPIRSMPRLVSLQGAVLSLNPSEFKFALQTDTELMPAASSAPQLEVSVKPRAAGGFEAFSRRLPMRLESGAALTGLPPVSKGRRWLTYSLSPESQAELILIQRQVKKLMAEKATNGGGSLSVGILQDELASDDPRFTKVRWESWLQTDIKSGYFELWSGTVSELKTVAKNAKK